MIFLKIEIYSIEQIVLEIIKPTNICTVMYRYMYLIICFIHKDQELYITLFEEM